MKLSERLDDLIVANITFPLTSYLMNRRNILRHYRRLIKSERLPQELLEDMQLRKAKKLILYANRWIPYYTEKFKEIGLAPEEIKSLDDIKRIPPLSRQDVIEHHREMVDLRCRASLPIADQSQRGPGVPASFARFRRHKLVKNTSSGSTGAPTTFYENGSTTALNWAYELRYKHWYGNHPGAREARLARLATDYLPNDKVLRMRKQLWHQLILPGVNLAEDDYARSLRQLEEFQPRILWGFTSALVGLAQYLRNHPRNASPFQPNLLINWAAPLYDHEEKILREVFQCSVTNIYGTREVGHIAALCPHGALHINQENLFVETQAPANEQSTSGPGEILVTTLEPSPMPFIRYRMGDLGELAPSQCPCGRTLQVIKNLLGRTGEIFTTRDGRMISPNFWCRTFMDSQRSKAVERFQVIYTKDGNIRIRLVKKESYSDQIENDFKQYLKDNFHSDVQFTFEYVPTIEPQISGKYQMVINEANS